MEQYLTDFLSYLTFVTVFADHVGDELIYLDPHTTQNYEDITREEGTDDTYHCPYTCRMNVMGLDPSIALVSTLWKQRS